MSNPDQQDPRYCPQCGKLGRLAYNTVRKYPAGGILRAYRCNGCGIGWDVVIRRIAEVRAVRPPEQGAKGCG